MWARMMATRQLRSLAPVLGRVGHSRLRVHSTLVTNHVRALVGHGKHRGAHLETECLGRFEVGTCTGKIAQLSPKPAVARSLRPAKRGPRLQLA
jgi:hypothetical protein